MNCLSCVSDLGSPDDDRVVGMPAVESAVWAGYPKDVPFKTISTDVAF